MGICGSESRVNMMVHRYHPVTLSMTSGDWEGDDLSCTATFRAEDLDDTLYYKFTDFSNIDGTEIRLDSRKSVSYVSEGRYSAAWEPVLQYEKQANTYLRVTVERSSRIRSHGFNFTLVITNRGNSGLLSSISSDTVVGSVVGGGAAVIGFLVVIALCRSQSRRRAHWRAAATNRGAPTTTICSTTAVYHIPPHAVQRGQLHPYPAGYPQPTHSPGCQQSVHAWRIPQPVAVSAYPQANNTPTGEQRGTTHGYTLPPTGSMFRPTDPPGFVDGPTVPGYVSHGSEYRSEAPPTYESLGFTDNNKR